MQYSTSFACVHFASEIVSYPVPFFRYSNFLPLFKPSRCCNALIIIKYSALNWQDSNTQAVSSVLCPAPHICVLLSPLHL